MEKVVPRFGRWGNVIIQFFLIFVISVVIYWLFVDPKIGVFSKTYPQPWFVWFFWYIMSLAWFGFGGGMWAFSKLKQPWQGIVATITTGLVALFMVWVTCFAWGSIDPTFKYGPPNHAGETASGLIVLFGFVFFNHWFLNWQDYPWSDAGMKQPWLGLAHFVTGWVVTLAFYLFLMYPNLAPFALKKGPMNVPVTIGWFYACLEIFLFMFIWDNWPFTAFKKRWQVGVSSFFGLFVLGTILYYIVLWMLKAFLLPAAVQQAIGEGGIPLWVAQYLVFTSMFVIFWGLVFVDGPWPTQYTPHVNRLIRLIIAFVVTTVTFYIYHYWIAGPLLHEVEVGGGFYGNALGFIDWYIAVNLTYCVYFGQPGFLKTIQVEGNP